VRLRDDPDALRVLVDRVVQKTTIPRRHVEKDFWLTEALRRVAAVADTERFTLLFKGGTSLSKAPPMDCRSNWVHVAAHCRTNGWPSVRSSSSTVMTISATSKSQPPSRSRCFRRREHWSKSSSYSTQLMLAAIATASPRLPVTTTTSSNSSDAQTSSTKSPCSASTLSPEMLSPTRPPQNSRPAPARLAASRAARRLPPAQPRCNRQATPITKSSTSSCGQIHCVHPSTPASTESTQPRTRCSWSLLQRTATACRLEPERPWRGSRSGGEVPDTCCCGCSAHPIPA
jgi:hypothetical protein